MNRFKISHFLSLFTILFLLLINNACVDFHSQQKKIDKSFELIISNPDSAIKYINKNKRLKNNKEVFIANWKLLEYYGLYKTTYIAPPDSLIDYARNYFIYTDEEYLKGLSFYLTGCSREYRMQSDSAVYWYKMADIVLGKISYNFDIKGLVKYNLGYVFLQNNHYDLAFKYLKESFYLFKETNKEKYLAYVLRDISYCYFLKNYQNEFILQILDIAYNMSKSSGDQINCDYIIAQKGEYLFYSDKSASKEILKNHIQKYPNSLKLAAYLADIYIEEEKFDSAKLYIIKSEIVNKNYRNKLLYNKVMYSMSEKTNDLEKSLLYLLNVVNLKDSLYINLINSKISEIDNRLESSNNKSDLLILKSKNTGIFQVLIFISICLIIIIYRFLENNKKHIIINNNLTKNLNLMKIEMDNITSTNEEKKVLLYNKLIDKTKYTIAIKHFKMSNRDSSKLYEIITQSFFGNIITENDWENIFNEIDQIFDNKLSKLLQEFGLTQNDRKVFTLIALKCDITDCCMLLNLTKNTLYHRRQLIKERLSLSKDTDLDVWISQYLTADPVPAAILPFPVVP